MPRFLVVLLIVSALMIGAIFFWPSGTKGKTVDLTIEMINCHEIKELTLTGPDNFNFAVSPGMFDVQFNKKVKIGDYEVKWTTKTASYEFQIRVDDIGNGRISTLAEPPYLNTYRVELLSGGLVR
jgi:hypothetical protein